VLNGYGIRIFHVEKITVLQGDPGEGKSTLILHIAAILTKGANLPDGNKIKNQ